MAKNKIILSGITGQTGSYLAELLLSEGYEVHGIIRRSSSFNTGRIEHLYKDPHYPTKLFLHYGDITDGTRISELVQKIQPDKIFNLACQSHVKVSFDEPVYSVNSGILGTLNFLEAIRHYSPHSKFLQASSSEMFGQVQEVPQSEKTKFYPRSPYACAKVYSHYQTVNYREAYNIFACCSICFNHEGPRRSPTFVTKKISIAAAKIKLGIQDKLYLGNLDAKRDWGHAHDYAKAMNLILEHDQPDDYVIATGETHSVKEFLTKTFEYHNLNWEKYVEIDPKYFRPAEVDLLIGDSTKARTVLGWKPEYTFDQLVKEMAQYDLEQETKNAKK